MKRLEILFGNVRYVIEPNGSEISIKVENILTGNKEDYLYHCKCPCGLLDYDPYDVDQVNLILDGLINKLK
jgi:hypothetical protein